MIWILVFFLVLIFLYDLRKMEIPDFLTIPAMGIALVFHAMIGAADLISLFLGAVIIGGFFFVQWLVSGGRWVGGGDIRMGLLMGLILGLKAGLIALMMAYLLGAAVSVMLLVMKKATRKTALPMGTFLSLTTILMMFLY